MIKYDFENAEKKWRNFWEENNYYKWNENDDNNFVVDTPPPGVSGKLHMGHIFSYTHTDFIVRFKRMCGYNIFYPMGFDDNGLPTEKLVEKNIGKRAKDVGKQEFIKLCQDTLLLEEAKFRDLFKNMGLSVDWSLEYQTNGKTAHAISQMSFCDLVNKGRIYRKNQPVFWDVIDQTATAQAEIEDKEVESIFYNIRFGDFIIGTTRPELMFACVAVFFHPDDERYQNLKGKYIEVPIISKLVPVLTDEKVIKEKGTGLVMCCSFGDSLDVEWITKYNLEPSVIIDKQGIITNPYIGSLKVKDARKKVLELLDVVSYQNIKHTVKCAERSGAPLEILLTPQWFIKITDLKSELLERSNELQWHPKHMKSKLDTWIHSLSWDWCISRQRFFGVPFPVWYSKRQGEEGKVLFASKFPVDPTIDLPEGYTASEVIPETDVMDTWATSSVSPQLCSLGINDKYYLDLKRHNKLFPSDLRPQAHEIIRTWCFYTILKAHLHQNTLPWKKIMISGWCLAEDKSKMSKSKGNAMDPEQILKKYGADVIRYWSSSTRLGNDGVLSENVLQDGKKFINKIVNAVNFGSKCFESSTKQISDIFYPLDLYFLKLTNEVIEKATKHFESYEYSLAKHCVENFFWFEFCDFYLEIVKTRFYNDNNPSAQNSCASTIYIILTNVIKLLAPIMPYVTEELYHYICNQSVHYAAWPKTFSICEENIEEGKIILQVISGIRKMKSELGISLKAEIDVVEVPGNMSKLSVEDIMNSTNAKTYRTV